jgi:hypothetical protein
MCSTPAGKRGQFFKSWVEGEGWEKVRVSANQCPRLSKEFLAEQLSDLGPQMFKQEFGLEFVDDSEVVFSTDMIARAFTKEIAAIW